MQVQFEVPGTPISINHMYHQRGRRRFLCVAGKKYKELVAKIAKPLFDNPLECDIKIELKYVFPDRRLRDCTNYDKGPLDALTGIAYVDDSQIQECVLRKEIGNKTTACTKIIVSWNEK
jgi:Holliday junction resolvase RusA-like endonuclease